MRILLHLFAGVLLVLFANTSLGFPSNTENDTNPKFKQAENYINQKEYNKAIPILNEIVKDDPQNADAYNYLGYSYRQIGNLDDAQKYYQKALKIDPNHKGANEYLGELYLMKNDLPKAEENLSVIKKACPTGCIEYDTLKKRIDDYKSKNKQ